MSLEASIKSLEIAVVNLTAVIQSMSQPSGSSGSESPPSPGQPGGAAATSIKRARKAAEKKPPEPAPEPPTDDSGAVDDKFKTLQSLVLKTVEKAGREAAVGALAECGAKRASDLKAEQYDDCIAALKATIQSAEGDLTS